MPRTVDKEAKKADILNTAMKVFARNGVVKTKMIDIATAAGIGKGTIYEYFRSKEEIFAQAYTHLFASMGSHLTDAISKTDDPVKKLNILVTFSLKEFIEKNGDFIGIMMDFWAEGIRQKDKTIMDIIALHEMYAQYRTMIAGILTDGIEKGAFRNLDVHSVSAIMIAGLDGLMLQWILDRHLFDMEQVSVAFMDIFLKGIKKN